MMMVFGGFALAASLVAAFRALDEPTPAGFVIALTQALYCIATIGHSL